MSVNESRVILSILYFQSKLPGMQEPICSPAGVNIQVIKSIYKVEKFNKIFRFIKDC